MTAFKGVVEIRGTIECLTGLHIGGGAVGYEIGGTENPVIRNPVTGYPYIPGTSLKGKMRSLLEWAEEGKLDLNGKPHGCSTDPDCPVCRIFGTSGAEERRTGPTRLLVRDAHPDDQTKERMDRLEREQGLPKVEVKTEVVIDRVAGGAGRAGPRSQERVPVGSRFNLMMQYWVFDVDGCRVSDLALLPKVFQSLRMVEDSALGGGGSRGSGQVSFHVLDKPLLKSVADYQAGRIPRPEGELVKLADVDIDAYCRAARARFG